VWAAQVMGSVFRSKKSSGMDSSIIAMLFSSLNSLSWFWGSAMKTISWSPAWPRAFQGRVSVSCWPGANDGIGFVVWWTLWTLWTRVDSVDGVLPWLVTWTLYVMSRASTLSWVAWTARSGNSVP